MRKRGAYHGRTLARQRGFTVACGVQDSRERPGVTGLSQTQTAALKAAEDTESLRSPWFEGTRSY